SRSLIRHHNRLHRSPPCVEFLPVRQQLHPLSRDGLSDRNGSIKILASPASMRNAEWPFHVCFIGIVSSVMCLFTGNVSYLPSCFDSVAPGRASIDNVFRSQTFITPVPGHADLVDEFALDHEGAHPARDIPVAAQSARCVDRKIVIET